MIKLFLEFLKGIGIDYGFFRLINYLSFRTIITVVSSLFFSLLLGHKFILFLYGKKFRDSSGEVLSINAYSKRGTPTAGGLLIITSTLLSLLLWGDFKNPYFLMLLFGFIYLGFVGFVDDFQKTRFKSSLSGLSELGKTILILLFIFPFTIFYFSDLCTIPKAIKTNIYIPFYKNPLINIGEIGFIIFIFFAMFSIINAVNITDGLDGLLSGTSSLTIGVYSILAYIMGNSIVSSYYLFPYIKGVGEVTVFGAALVGSLLGFLWYNSYPAEMFMGDTGSLAIGGVLAMMVFFTKQEMLFLIAGGIFVFEILTSLLQEKIGDRIGRRILYRAPFHHSMTHRGIAEPKAVLRLWIIAIILAAVSLLSLKVR